MSVKVVSIVGPTAIGKTDLSIKIAKIFNAEIISGDSMQVYKDLNIGTAKVTEDEMEGIAHYMVDILDADEEFTVADFKKEVQFYIDFIRGKSKLPILVGGSGHYIQAALYDYQFLEGSRDEEYEKYLEKKIKTEGIEALYEQLKEIDPKQAKKIHPNNHRRVIRALEIYKTTGKAMSEHLEEQSSQPLYNVKIIGLDMDRDLLYKRINERVDLMIEAGLIKEVRELYESGNKDCQSMTGIGYKEFIPYFEGEMPLEDCIAILKRNTRRYAKRQLTFFRNRLSVDWYNIDEKNREDQYQKIIDDLAGFLTS